MTWKVMLGLIAALVAGCASPSEPAPKAPAPSSDDDIPRISRIPMTTPAAASRGCDPAPARIVDMINAGFTNGEHIEDVAALNGPQASTYIAGNIYESSGARSSSHNAWIYRDGGIYALTKDARRHTLFTDGRDIAPADFFSGADWEALGDCINAAARAAGK